MAYSKKALWGLPLTLTLGVVACGSNDDAGNGDGTGGTGGSATGGGAATGGATTGTGGDSTSGGSNSGGTGGQVALPTRVPGTELYDCDAPSGTLPLLQLTEIASDYARPVLVTHAPNDADRLFVVEQGGIIRIIDDVGGTPTKLEAPFLDISDRVQTPTNAWDEFGMLGLAFHPDFETNGLFYVYFSADDSLPESDERDGILEEYKVSDADPNVADEATMRRVLRIDQPSGNSNHNGAMITFGLDGMLYLSLGDGGGSGDTYGNGQNKTSLLAKILRIDVDERDAGQYGIPAGNIADTDPAMVPEAWSWGLRNPFRMNFDACTGDLFIGDVGQGDWEEVNVEPAGQGGKNYGWPIMEATHCYNAASCDETGLTLPVTEYENNGGAAVIGGAVYRGTAIPALRGQYLFGDSGSGRVWRFSPNGTSSVTPTEITEDLESSGRNFYSIQNGGDGEIYLSTGQGVIYRLDAE